jgi:hypothetical protein
MAAPPLPGGDAGSLFPTLTPAGLTPATPGDYYVNLLTGTIQQQTNPILAKALVVAGYAGPFGSIADAKAAFNAASGAAALGASGGLGAATAAGVTPGSAFAGFGGILAPLFQANLWLRVAEVAAGLILLAIGVNALFKGKPLETVTKIAAAAPKVVPV